MLSSHIVGFQRPDNSNLANLTPGLCSSSWSWVVLEYYKWRAIFIVGLSASFD